MTSDQIRSTDLDLLTDRGTYDFPETAAAFALAACARMLREATAQLAQLNENLSSKKNVETLPL